MSDEELVQIGGRPGEIAGDRPPIYRLAVRPPDGERRFMLVLDCEQEPSTITDGQGAALEQLVGQAAEAVRAILAQPPETLRCSCAGLSDARGRPVRSPDCPVHGREAYGA